MIPSFADIIKSIISCSVVGVFLYLAIRNNDLKDALIAGFSGVLGYWIGSSQGSAQKTELLK